MINTANIPSDLKKLPQWVCWRFETREGKQTKVPYQVNGDYASTTDAETWNTFEAVLEAFLNASNHFDGIGFVVTSNDKYCGIDLDHCRNAETGAIDPDKQEIINQQDSYTEITPSNTGVRIWIRGKIPENGGKRDDSKHIEIYDQGRFFTVTGRHLEGTPATIEKRQDELNQFHATIFPPAPAKEVRHPAAPLDISDAELIDKAKAARNGDSFTKLMNGDTSEYGKDESRADLALCSKLAFWFGNDETRIDTVFRKSGLYREKWERKDYREGTIKKAINGNHEVYNPFPPSPPRGNGDNVYICPESSATDTKHYKTITETITKSGQKKEIITTEKIEEWIKGTSGWFTTEELDGELGIKTAEDKNLRRVTICRLGDKIERHQSQNKLLRCVDKTARIIDFKSIGDRDPLDFKFPFQLERLVNIFPKNIIVVAGSQNAGKTGWLLNLVRLNMSKFSIYYFSSEMGEDELRLRLRKFEGIDINDWNFTAEERSANFADVIRPDCVNIIDFLEIYKDFNEIAGQIRQIYDKLGSGIAIIAIQKNPGVEITAGRGGSFSLEKPRLYLAMDDGITSISKGKNWANPLINPYKLKIQYKIVNGCKFIVEHNGGWTNPEGEIVLKVPNVAQVVQKEADF